MEKWVAYSLAAKVARVQFPLSAKQEAIHLDFSLGIRW